MQSEVARVDLAAGRVVHRFLGLGIKSHCIVSWRDSLLMLDSDTGDLIKVNPADGSYTTLYTVHFPHMQTLEDCTCTDPDAHACPRRRTYASIYRFVEACQLR